MDTSVVEILNKYLDESLEEINNSKSKIENIMKCLLNEIFYKFYSDKTGQQTVA